MRSATRLVGATANVLAIVCIAAALVEHESKPTAAFGALDRDAVAVTRPHIVPWLVAAAVLVALGTGLLLRRRGD